MLTRGQQILLTLTGPGTPGGELLRRSWQPTALSAELPQGGPAVAFANPLADRVLPDVGRAFRKRG
jgi:hypothetical protein